MELASIIINFGLFAATVIAAIITWKGVRDSREARDLAADHESKALAHAKEAATAATCFRRSPTSCCGGARRS